MECVLRLFRIGKNLMEQAGMASRYSQNKERLLGMPLWLCALLDLNRRPRDYESVPLSVG